MHFQAVCSLQVLGDINRHTSRITSTAACFILGALILTSSLIQDRVVSNMLKGLETMSYKFELNKWRIHGLKEEKKWFADDMKIVDNYSGG